MAGKRTAGLGTTFHTPGRLKPHPIVGSSIRCDRESIDGAQRELYVENVGHEPSPPTIPPGMTEDQVRDQWEWPRAKRRKHCPLTLIEVALVTIRPEIAARP